MSTDSDKRPRPQLKNPNKKNANYRGNRKNTARKGVPPRRRKPAPKLTWWQKFLKAIGLYKDPASKKKASKKATANKRTTKKTAKKRAPKQAPPQKVESPRLYIGNLSYDTTESDLIDLFKGFGNVRKAEIIYNKRTQRSKGFAFVEMMNTDDAKRASEVLHEQPFMGRNMIVNGARTEEEERNAVESPAA